MKCHVHVLIVAGASRFLSAGPSCSLCLRRSFGSVCTRSIYLQRLPGILVHQTIRGVDGCFSTFLFRRFIKGQLTIRRILLRVIQNLGLLHQRQRSQLLHVVLCSYQYGFLLRAVSPMWLCSGLIWTRTLLSSVTCSGRSST